MEDSFQEIFQGSQLPILHKGCSYGYSLIPITGNEGTQGEIPYTLLPTNLLISLLPAPQLDVKRTIWKGLM